MSSKPSSSGTPGFARLSVLAGTGAAALALAACQDGGGGLASGRSAAPIPQQTLAEMSSKGMTKYDPILIRSFKKESEVEIWKRTKSGQYALLKTFPICRWSGQLGPKVKEGDRQAPEGFYTITQAQMNPNSSYYLSFDTGYPNAFDRAYGRTGAHLMVHGACSSAGCFSMTDQQIAEIYAIARESFIGGQRSFQFQSYPFRMTAKNLAIHRADPNMAFWRNLKEGNDAFEVTKTEPKVGVCGKRYVFNANASARLDPSGPCPDLNVDPAVAQAVAQKDANDRAEVASLVTSGTQAIKLVYSDGDQHRSFKTGSSSDSPVVSQRIADVSRPEALANGPQEIALDDGGREIKPKLALPDVQPTAVAAALPKTTPAQPKPSQVAAQAPAPQMPAMATAYAAQQPVAASTTSGEPFYKRLLSPFNVFGSAPAPAPAEASATETAPARQQQGKRDVTKPAQGAVKPQASLGAAQVATVAQ